MEIIISDNQTITRKENLDLNQYAVSLLQEGFRVGLIDKQTIFHIHEQILFILKDLILKHTKGESSSVKIETAEQLLLSIYYSIDACIASFNNPEDSLAVLKSKNIKDIYENGLELVTTCVADTKKLYNEVVNKKLDVPLEVYKTSIEESFPDFFRNYSVVFNAHETMCSVDYPLVFDDMNIQGIFYIKHYLENLETETAFCRLFNKEDILKTLANFGRICSIDYEESPVNLFEILINNSIFSVLLGNNAGSLTILKFECEILQRKFSYLNPSETNLLINEAIEKMIKELIIDQPKLIAYIQRYKAIFIQRLLNAVQNNSLHNIIMTDAEENLSDGSICFLDGNRMSDESFRSVIREIMGCAGTTDKINIIKSSIHSLEDFVDVLKADCLFGDEFAAVFSTLSDMEMAVLGRTAFFEELRNGPLNLSSISSDKEIATEWQVEYLKFIQQF